MPIKLEELSRFLRDADSAAVLVPSAVLVRLIQNLSGEPWLLWRVPHRHCYLVDRYTLFEQVEQEELYLPPDHLLPETVLLLERPTTEQLNAPREEVLGRYWQMLFHISLHRELAERFPAGDLREIHERIDQLGLSIFEEVKNVLGQDGLLATTADDRDSFIEFVATYWELRYFSPNLIPVYFPSLPGPEVIEPLLGEGLNPAELFERTRLGGIANIVPKTDDQSDESHDYFYRLQRGAQRASQNGDTVAAAILFTRAARVAPASLTEPALERARQEIYRLIDRLRPVLNLIDDDVTPWRKVLPALLDKADQGNRPVEAAILQDLQRACLDHEQKIYTLDLLEWLLSGGHRPIRRELDSQRYVRIPAHLRAAIRRLTAARLTDADRQALGELLKDALNRSEERLRARFRPTLTDALKDAGLRPSSIPEQAALAKTVEELIDRISASGFLSFADVRDAIARGQLKMPDLSGPQEYLRGDPLLRLDRRLATLLDGVYHRGEFYVRALERLTAFNFGTETGRWMTRNLTLPFGSALLACQFLWLIVYESRIHHNPPLEPVAAITGGAVSQAVKNPSFFAGWNAEWWFHALWLTLGLILLALIRSATLRRAAETGLRLLYRGARTIFWELPQRLWAIPIIRAFFTSGPILLLTNFLLKPAGLTFLLTVAFPDWTETMTARSVLFLFAAMLINSRIGRAVEAILFQTAESLILLLQATPAVVRWISVLFRQLTDWLEWMLAQGEDWLRIRGNAGTIALILRVVAGLIWFPFAFLIRLYLVVLIEPMINPLKLPLSILFAKFVYPLLAVLGLFTLSPLGSPLVDELSPWLTWPVAWVLVIGTFYLLPDAVTFLFWETRENWKLYRANRPDQLRPVAVGPHGETMGQLLHWGFHSGTIPKLYARLRAAEREAALSGNWRDVRGYRQSLREVQESVSRFVTRDLAAVLNPTMAWAEHHLDVGRVHLGTNRIRVELILDSDPEQIAILEWEDRSGWLVAGWAKPGWIPHLRVQEARALANSLAYLYKRAGVDLVREHVLAQLPRTATHLEFVPAGILVWYGPREAPPMLYDLLHGLDEIHPRSYDLISPAVGPPLSARRLLFSRVRLTWREWLSVWEADQTGAKLPRFGPEDFQLVLLPDASLIDPPSSPILSLDREGNSGAA